MTRQSNARACALLVALTFLLSSAAFAQGGESDLSKELFTPPHPWQVSLAGDFALGPHNTALLEGGLGVNYEVSKGWRVGLSDIGLASSPLLSGTRWGLSVAPMAEYYSKVSNVFGLSAGLAFPIQWRWGADIDSKVGFLPSVQLGADVFINEWFSVGVVERAGLVLSDGFIRTSHVLPQNAMVYATGLSAIFHF
jgi:hypothetical protein